MKYCLDTNILFSFQQGLDLGTNPSEVIRTLIRVKEKTPQMRFMVPPSIKEEMGHIAQPDTQSDLTQLFTVVEVVSPHVPELSINAQVFEDYLLEGRHRNLLGLKAAEETIMRVAETGRQPFSSDRVTFQKSLQPFKENLRDRYRNATRTGYLDSVADLHLILLAKQEDAYLISADEGVMIWGRKCGVKELPLPSFGLTLRQLLS